MRLNKVEKSFAHKNKGVLVDGNRTLTKEEYERFRTLLLYILRHWKLSRTNLADEMGISRYTLYRYETNVAKPSFVTLQKTINLHRKLVALVKRESANE